MKKNIKMIIMLLFGIIVGAASGIGVYATLTYNAGDIAYTKSGSSTPISVSSALNELYQNKKETTNDTKSITSNGSISLDKYYKNVNVNVPIPAGYIQPSGTQTITANGNYDITSKSNVKVNVTAAGTKTLLWLNNNPNSSMAGTDVSLNDSLENYSHILLQWKAKTNSTTLYEDIFKVQPYRSNLLGEGNVYAICIDNSDSSMTYVRYLRYKNDTLVRFPGVRTTGTDADLNSKCIPVAIYGLNISY